MTSPPTQPSVELSDDVAPYVEVLRFVELRQKQLDDFRKIAQTAVKQALGDAETGTVAGEPVVFWRHVAGGERLNRRRLCAEHPDMEQLLEEYTEPGPGSRRFTLAAAAAATPQAAPADTTETEPAPGPGPAAAVPQSTAQLLAHLAQLDPDVVAGMGLQAPSA
jgi:hypothetical protein